MAMRWTISEDTPITENVIFNHSIPSPSQAVSSTHKYSLGGDGRQSFAENQQVKWKTEVKAVTRGRHPEAASLQVAALHFWISS